MRSPSNPDAGIFGKLPPLCPSCHGHHEPTDDDWHSNKPRVHMGKVAEYYKQQPAAVQHRAVAAFLGQAEPAYLASQQSDADRKRIRAEWAQYPWLSERQMQRRRDREGSLDFWADGSLNTFNVDREYLYEGGRREERNEQKREARRLAAKPVGRPRGNPEEQAERKRQYNRDRRASLRGGNNDVSKTPSR